jgi:tripartite-type tricarboxylate transporter receptor subunit TctC
MRPTIRSGFAGWIVCLITMPFGAGIASAQDFPNKPLRILTQPTGGGTDFASRMIAAGVTPALGQQVIVDNRPGTIAIETAAKAPPDGYTLLLYANGMWVEPFLRSGVTYDPVRDFLPLTWVASSPNVLVVHPLLPVKSVKDLVALAKSRPGELNYSSAGGGTPNHLAAELFKVMAKINIVHVPYKGTGAALTGLISGEVQIAFPNAAGAAPLVRSGRVKGLAVTTKRESVLFPGLPAVAQVLPGYESVGIVGMFVVAKTPPAIVTRLNEEIVRVLRRPDVIERFRNSGVEVVGSTPEEFAAAMKADMAKWAKVIKEAGIHAE